MQYDKIVLHTITMHIVNFKKLDQPSLKFTGNAKWKHEQKQNSVEIGGSQTLWQKKYQTKYRRNVNVQ